MNTSMDPGRLSEQRRLDEERDGNRSWQYSGPCLSERQWGTVREDYSSSGNAWDSLPHDHARSRAYRWGEDGIGGFSDRHQRLCLSLALWNGKDPILKERLFGLTNSEGNHGEDVKERYDYLDALPSHRYLKMLYKYLFCENDTNVEHLFDLPGEGGSYKDGIHECVVRGDKGAVNPSQSGTRVAAWYKLDILPDAAGTIRVRLTPEKSVNPFAQAEEVIRSARGDADAYYNFLSTTPDTVDARAVQRQAFAGMIWGKQFYYFDIPNGWMATRLSRHLRRGATQRRLAASQ